MFACVFTFVFVVGFGVLSLYEYVCLCCVFCLALFMLFVCSYTSLFEGVSTRVCFGVAASLCVCIYVFCNCWFNLKFVHRHMYVSVYVCNLCYMFVFSLLICRYV